MKKNLFLFAFWVVYIIFVYAAFGFVIWSFDPSEWKELQRFLYVFFGPVLGLFGAGIYWAEHK